MVETRTFFFKSSTLSPGRTTMEVRLQNCLERRVISPQGLEPGKPTMTFWSSIIPAFFQFSIRRSGSCAISPPRLNIPRSPAPDFISSIHSFRNSEAEGFWLYTAELLAIERCPFSIQNCPCLDLRIDSSSISEREIKVLRRTPP